MMFYKDLVSLSTFALLVVRRRRPATRALRSLAPERGTLSLSQIHATVRAL